MDEVEQLRQWKTEAMPVLDGLQELGKELGIPLGKRITGTDALEAVRKLKAERNALHAGAEALVASWVASMPGARQRVNTNEDFAAIADEELVRLNCAAQLRAVLARSQAPAERLFYVDSWTGAPCPTRGNLLCAITDPDHRHRDGRSTQAPAEEGAICGYDVGDLMPCRCLLPRGHAGMHKCKHTAPFSQDPRPGERGE